MPLGDPQPVHCPLCAGFLHMEFDLHDERVQHAHLDECVRELCLRLVVTDAVIAGLKVQLAEAERRLPLVLPSHPPLPSPMLTAACTTFTHVWLPCAGCGHSHDQCKVCPRCSGQVTG